MYLWPFTSECYDHKIPNCWGDTIQQNHRMPSLMDLAIELHLMIIPHLAPIDRACLSFTSRYFRKIVPTLKKSELTRIEHQINNASSRPKVLQCYNCKKVRYLSRFADKMYEVYPLKTKTSVFKLRPLAFNWESFCIQCCIRSLKTGYGDGEVIIVQNQYHVVCVNCRRSELLTSAKRRTRCSTCDETDAKKLEVAKSKLVRKLMREETIIREVREHVGKSTESRFNRS